MTPACLFVSTPPPFPLQWETLTASRRMTERVACRVAGATSHSHKYRSRHSVFTAARNLKRDFCKMKKYIANTSADFQCYSSILETDTARVKYTEIKLNNLNSLNYLNMITQKGYLVLT